VWRFWAALFLALVASFPAAAHSRVFVGLGFGPFFVPGPYYGYYPWPYYPPYYYAPPYGYYPPPYAYYPPPPAAFRPPAPGASSHCREYRGDAIIDGANQPFYGTACLQADGKWHIVD
jgi:hypothetical protein